MTNEFDKKEKFYRAVIWSEIEEGIISSGAFNHRDLSVDRQLNRENKVAVKYISAYKKGWIVSIQVSQCDMVDVKYVERPENNNPYHCILYKEIYGDRLTRAQSRFLAKNCIIELQRDDND